MNCKDWEERLALYPGGDLAKDEESEVERHLGECPGCQLFSSGLKEAQELLQQSHREPLGPAHFAAVRARVLSELERERPVGQTIVFGGLSAFWRRRWVFGLAAVAAALITLTVLPPVRSLLVPGPKPGPKPPIVAAGNAPGNAGGLAAGVLAQPVTPATRQEPAIMPGQRRTRPKAQPGEQVLIRMVSDNPDVVIYWIADTKGD